MNINYKISNISLEVLKLLYSLELSTSINHLSNMGIELVSNPRVKINKFIISIPNTHVSEKIESFLTQYLSSGDTLLSCLKYLSDKQYIRFDNPTHSGGGYVQNINLTSNGIDLIEGVIVGNETFIKEVNSKFTFFNFEFNFDKIFGVDIKGLDLSNLISIGNTN